MLLCETTTTKGDSVALIRGKPRQSLSENITKNLVIGSLELGAQYSGNSLVKILPGQFTDQYQARKTFRNNSLNTKFKIIPIKSKVSVKINKCPFIRLIIFEQFQV